MVCGVSIFQRISSLPFLGSTRCTKLLSSNIKASIFSQELPLNLPMIGAYLPGDSTVQFAKFDYPKPKYGEVVVQTKCSTICGSDIRCIYRKHEGSDQEAYKPGTICGHEPAGIIAEVGPGTRRFKVGDRVIVYHISGCGVCHDCRRGFMISCQDDNYRKSYGFQRNGGMAPFILTEEKVNYIFSKYFCGLR